TGSYRLRSRVTTRKRPRVRESTWPVSRRPVLVTGTSNTMGWAFYVQVAVPMRLLDAVLLHRTNLVMAGPLPNCGHPEVSHGRSNRNAQYGRFSALGGTSQR